MSDNLRRAFAVKSDQLNNEDLIGGPMTITVTRVWFNFNSDQPCVINFEGDNGKPWKPSKGMGHVLEYLWGGDENQWVGRSVTLYRDPEVKFGRDKTGGIRISHATHIQKAVEVTIKARRGQYVTYRIEPLQINRVADNLEQYRNSLSMAVSGGLDALADAWSKIPGDIAPKLVDHKDQCKAQIQRATQQPQQQGFTPAQAQQPEQQTPQQQSEPAAVATDPSQL